MLRNKLLWTIVVCIAFPFVSLAQVTTSNLGGSVIGNTGDPLLGATIKVTHEPTGTVYKAQSRTGGRFDIANLNPGGPYTIEVSYLNYATEKKADIYINLGETFKIDFVLTPKTSDLGNVTVSGTRKTSEVSGKGGTTATIGKEKMDALPTVGRNVYDYLRAIPQARLTSGTSEGGITIAGQNNRYNSFYVDGALNNDVFGLAASGTNGGQANNAAPISLDAIDQFQIAISPYDVSVGNFTGGGINAITKSGTNVTTGSVYYFWRNQNLAGKDPTVDKSIATKFPDFSNKTYGVRVGGPLIKNKLFYFISYEQQRDQSPQQFNLANYLGNTNTSAGIQQLTDFVKNTYGYDMGDYLLTYRKLDVDRIAAKLDWNINDKHKLSLSFRQNNAKANNPSLSSSTSINFSNGAVYFPSNTKSVSAELKSNVGRGANNKLLFTYTNVIDDRGIVGSPFPRVSITDGSGSINFGSDNSSTQNLLTQKNISLVDNLKFNVGKHAMTLGVDYEYFDDFNVFIQNTYGNYGYTSVAAFLANNAAPRSYTLGFPLTDNKLDDNTGAAAKFKVAKGAAYWNDEIRVNNNLTLNIGIRGDLYKFLSIPATDQFTNDSAIPKFAQYYDLKGARSGQRPNFPLALSPRFGFTYKIPEENITIRGGIGMFVGRMPLVWPGGVYNNNGLYVGGYTASTITNPTLSSIRFRWDPNNIAGSVWASGPGTKGPLNLISSDFRMPKLLRTSLAIDKKFQDGWSMTLEGLFSKNINEIDYTNINILPPTGVSVGPGSRNVYGVNGSATATIPIRSNGTNPYDNAILVSNNNRDQKGFSYTLTASVDKKTKTGFYFNFNYSFGNSLVLNDGTSSVNLSQWRFNETVNGRNYIQRSISRFDPGHRIFAIASKKFTYANRSMATTVSLVYTGASGLPISYVYGSNSMTRDDGTGGGNDLIYIPTTNELQSQVFLSNTVNGVTYTDVQQKAALENYIQNDPYLRRNRGKFAERNGAHLPFTNTVDLKIAQDFNVKVSGKVYQLQLTWDVVNFTNLLNRNWGRNYFASNDQFSLISFAGYVSPTNLTPQYRFNPNITKPWNYNNTVTPAYANRWVSQLGVRFNF